MKKMLALLLALMLALTCTMALAETTGIPPILGITVQSENDVDREVLKNALTQMGVDENTLSLIDSVAAVISESSEKVVVAPNGFQYEELLKGTSIFSLVSQFTENGVLTSTSLLPNYAFAVSMEEIGQMMQGMAQQAEGLQALDTEALAKAITGYSNTFIDACVKAVTPGQPEQGDFVLDGISYNIKVPLNVDLAAIIDASNKMTADLFNDETVKSAIETLKGMGVNIEVPESTDIPVDPATLPTVAVDAYMSIDEQGNQGDTTDVVFSVTLPGTEEPATMGDVLVQGKNVRIIAQFLTAGLNVGCTVEPTENGGSFRSDFNYNGMYLGFASVCDNQESATVVDSYAYLMDDANPVFTNHTTIENSGELTLSADGEGKTVVALTDLFGEGAEELTGGIVMDFMFNGLGSMLSTAGELMPHETGAITSLFMGGAQEPAA